MGGDLEPEGESFAATCSRTSGVISWIGTGRGGTACITAGRASRVNSGIVSANCLGGDGMIVTVPGFRVSGDLSLTTGIGGDDLRGGR